MKVAWLTIIGLRFFLKKKTTTWKVFLTKSQLSKLCFRSYFIIQVLCQTGPITSTLKLGVGSNIFFLHTINKSSKHSQISFQTSTYLFYSPVVLQFCFFRFLGVIINNVAVLATRYLEFFLATLDHLTVSRSYLFQNHGNESM